MMRRTPMPRGSGFKQKARARPERAQEEVIDDSPTQPHVVVLHAEPRVYEALSAPGEGLRPEVPLIRGELGAVDAGFRVLPQRRGTYDGGLAAALPKAPRGENRQLLDLAKGEQCLLQTPICNNRNETVVACHPRGVASEGTGGHYKASDDRTIFGCVQCNFYTDAYAGASAEEKAAAFEEARPRQIARWKEIAATDRKEPRRRAALWALQRLGEA